MISPLKATVHKVIWCHFCGQWPRALLEGHLQYNSMVGPKGLKFWISTLYKDWTLGECAMSPWVTEYWASHGAMLLLSAGLPHHHRKHWARLKDLYFGAALLKKTKKRPCLYAALLTHLYIFDIVCKLIWNRCVSTVIRAQEIRVSCLLNEQNKAMCAIAQL
jgi:hypothetical protein